MKKTNTILGLIGGAAAASIIYIFANAGKRHVVSKKRASACKPDTMATFTEWLEKLKNGIDNEVKR